jgi:phosphatidylglycerophosphate synthase
MSRPAASARTRAHRAFALRFALGILLYGAGLALAVTAERIGVPAWIPALLILPAVVLMAWANVAMYRSGDEFERRKIAEAVLFAFMISTSLILAVGFLQFFLLPALNWIFAFSILMAAWIVGTIVSAVRYR